MNEKYIVDTEGIVSVVTDNGQIIEKGKYSKNTEEILSLENYAESTGNKVNFYEQKLNELNYTIRNKYKIKRKINIILLILMFLLLVVCAIMSAKLFLIVAISSIPIYLIVETVERLLMKKDKDKRTDYNKKYVEETCQLKKIQKKIEMLTKDKTAKQIEATNTFIEVAPIKNYDLDAKDYFIGKYKLDKRVRELAHSKPKTKKLTRKRNQTNMYEI